MISLCNQPRTCAWSIALFFSFSVLHLVYAELEPDNDVIENTIADLDSFRFPTIPSDENLVPKGGTHHRERGNTQKMKQNKGKGSPQPSSMPSIKPSSSIMPSRQPTSTPSSMPSSQPTSCMDTPNWVMPLSSKWENSPLVNMTCAQLEAYSTAENNDEWCKFLSQDTIDGECAVEACCFCGGGTTVDVPCENIPGWTIGGILDCDFIEKSADPTGLCTVFRESLFDGMLPSDSCCVCGGGAKPVGHYSSRSSSSNQDHSSDSPEDSRRVEEAPGEETKPIHGTCESTTCTIDQRDWTNDVTTRIGAGDSPGVPNLDYLGAGYDSLRGNPRGSLNSEVDPGFRYRVIALEQNQSLLSVDQEYMIPMGTELKYTSSCKYDSQSVEISSERDYRRSLATESRFDAKVGVQGQFEYEGVAAKVESEVAWGESEKFQRFVSGSESQNTVTFEARAICSEFEASFNPYEEQKLDKNFDMAMKALPVPYDPGNPTHKASFTKFIRAYGTHYVRQVTLGAKRILSTSMTSLERSQLVREEIDVEATLSVDIQLAIGSPKYVRDALVSGDTPTIVNNNNFDSGSIKSVIDALTGGGDDTEVEPGGTVSVSYDDFSSTSRQSQNAQRISETRIVTSEINVGGLPDVDWRAWAASVKEKPMPISYDLAGIWTVMPDEERKEAFFDALIDIEGIDLEALEDNPALDALHFGVASGTGEPLSTYSLNPNAEYRALLQVGNIPSSDSGTDSVFGSGEAEFLDVHTTGSAFANPKFALKDTQYACGARVAIDDIQTNVGNDDEGIVEIFFKFCDVDDWAVNSGWINLDRESDEKEEENPYREATCDSGQFIDGMRVRYCGLDDNSLECEQDLNEDDVLGIASLQISCNEIGGGVRTRKPKTVYCEDDAADLLCNDENSWKPWVYVPMSSDPGNRATVIVGGSVQQGSSNTRRKLKEEVGKHRLLADDVGIEGLRFYWEDVPKPNPDDVTAIGPETEIITYTATWRTKIDRPTPIFVQMIRGDVGKNTDEELNQLGFTEIVAGEKQLDLENNLPFGTSSDFSSGGSIGVTNFGRSLQAETLQSFSFLTVDNLKDNEGFILSGVIRNDGLIVSQRPGVKPGLQVAKNGNNDFSVTMVGEAAVEDSTVVAFPQFFTNNGASFPQNIGDVTVAVGPVADKTVNVKAGISDGVSARSLGFNFLAVSRNLKNSVLKHGYVNGVVGASSMDHLLDGLGNPMIQYKAEATTEAMLTGVPGGVFVPFSPPVFDALPVVVTTPVISESSPCSEIKYAEEGVQALPRCIVESISPDSCFVKCGCVASTDGVDFTFTPLPFNIIAVGPTS